MVKRKKIDRKENVKPAAVPVRALRQGSVEPSARVAVQHGGQHAQGQGGRDRAAQIACINRWGAQLVRVVNTRTDATARLDKAKAEHDDAFDQVALITNGARQIPPRYTARDFDHALGRLARAVENLRKVTAETAVTRESTPYPPSPTLTCGPKG